MPIDDPIYKTKEGKQVTRRQLLESGYSEKRIDKGLSNGILSSAGDTQSPGQVFKTKDGQTVTYEDLISSGYSEDRINKGIQNGILSADGAVKKKESPFSALSKVGGKAASNGTTGGNGAGQSEEDKNYKNAGIPSFVQNVDFRSGYIPQVSRNPNADVPSVQVAKDKILSLAEQQSQSTANFSKTIGTPSGQVEPSDEIYKNMQQANILAVKSGDIDAVTKVIQQEKARLQREKENLPEYISNQEVGIQSLNIAGGYESPETKLANQERDLKLKELDGFSKSIIDDGLKVVANSIQKEYALSSDKSIYTQKMLGEKYRKAATDIQAKNADGTIDNYVDQKSQAAFLLKNKYDKSLGIGRINNTEGLQSKYQQEFDFSNQATFLGTKASADYENVQEYLKNGEVVKFLSPQTTDAERVELKKNPIVSDFLEAYSTLNKTVGDVKKLPSLYPKVQQQLQAEKVFQAFGDYVANRRKTVAGEAVQSVADVFSGYKLDEESEFKAVAELTGMSVDEVRQVAKDNPESSYIPSSLRKIVNSASGVLNGIEQSFNRGVLPSTEASIVNKEISSEVFRTPEAFRLKDNNITIRSVVDGMANGTGQFLGFAALTALGGEVLAIPKSAGLFSEVGLLSRATGVSAANLSTEAASLVNAMDKVKTVAGTFGVGYASSYESAYKEASRYTNNEDERKAYAQGDAFFNGISELILPDVALARQLGKSGTSKVLAALKSGKPLTAAEALLIRFGEGAKVIGLETAEEMIPLAYDVLAKDQIFDYKTSSSELMKQMYETALVTAVSTVPMALGAGFRSPTSHFTKSALYNAGLNAEKFTNIINDKIVSGELSQDDANLQIKTISTMQKVVSEVEQISKDGGFEDDTEKKTELAAQLFRKKINNRISENVSDDTQKKKYQEDNKLADDEIESIVANTARTSEQVEEELRTQLGEEKANTFAKDVKGFVDADLLPAELSQQEKDEAVTNPLGFLKAVADQANTPLVIGDQTIDTKERAISKFGEDAVKLAQEAFPAEKLSEPIQEERSGTLTTVYHGGNLESGEDGNLYVTKDKRQANAYSQGNDGTVNEFKLDTDKIATEEEVRDIIQKLGLQSKANDTSTDELGLHELIDNRFDTSLSDADIKKLFDEIKSQGKDGISFNDEDILQEKKGGVESILIFDKSKLLENPAIKKTTEMLNGIEKSDSIKFNDFVETDVVQNAMPSKFSNKEISKAYHADKAAGKETDLTKAVEELLNPTQKVSVGGDKSALGDVESTAKALEGVDKINPTVWTKIKEAAGIAFHGSPFNRFSAKDYIPNEKGLIFFTKTKEFAETYQSKRDDLQMPKNVVAGEGGVSEQIITPQKTLSYKNIPQDVIDVLENHGNIDHLTPERKGYGVNGYNDYSEAIKDAAESGDWYLFENKKVIEELKKLGYDSIELTNQTAYNDAGQRGSQDVIAVFDKSLIKDVNSKNISEAYHKAKADGTNPELVKAVESLLKEQPTEPKQSKVGDVEAAQIQEKEIEVARQDAIIEAEKPVIEDFPVIEMAKPDPKSFVVKKGKRGVDADATRANKTEFDAKKEAFKNRRNQLAERYKALKELINC